MHTTIKGNSKTTSATKGDLRAMKYVREMCRHIHANTTAPTSTSAAQAATSLGEVIKYFEPTEVAGSTERAAS